MNQELQREFLLSFFKVHILHHAAEEPVYGQAILQELRQHGYEVSPGTIYPLLKRMAARGWLSEKDSARVSSKDRQEYILTYAGNAVLTELREKIAELFYEVCSHK